MLGARSGHVRSTFTANTFARSTLGAYLEHASSTYGAVSEHVSSTFAARFKARFEHDVRTFGAHVEH
eukprot:1279174-Lingulodinium_polyedra.AAC.1